MIGDELYESPQFSNQRNNLDISPNSQMSHQIISDSEAAVNNQTQFSHYTIKEFSLNGSPNKQQQIMQSFSNNGFDKKIGNTQMSVILEEQQKSCAFSQVVISKQNIDDSYSSQNQLTSKQNSAILGYNYKENVPSKPKILHEFQDNTFIQNLNPVQDRKIAAKQIILGPSLQINDNNSKIYLSNDQKRQTQLQALMKSNQESSVQLQEVSILKGTPKQSCVELTDQNNTKPLSNISFYKEQGNEDECVYQISNYSFTPKSLHKQQQQHHALANYPDQFSASQKFTKNQKDTFAGITSVSASFHKGFQNNIDYKQRNNNQQQDIHQSNPSLILNNQNYKIQESSENLTNQDSQQMLDNGGRLIEKQQIQEFLNSKTLKNLKKSLGQNSRQKRQKRSLNQSSNQDKSQNNVHQYINSQNTKETITDYFKMTNAQVDQSLPSFDQYLSNFKSQYDKNIKRRLKSSINRKSYDIPQQNSKGFSSYYSKEDSTFILRENTAHTPQSTTNKQIKLLKSTAGGYIMPEQQTEDGSNFQLFINQQLQQQQQRTPQLIEIEPKLDAEVQRDASTIIRSIQNKIPPTSISSSSNDTSHLIRDINNQLISIRNGKHTKPQNKQQKCLTEYSESETSSSLNNTQNLKNQSSNARIQENIKELQKLSTIHQEDTKYELNSPSKAEEMNDFTFAQKTKKGKSKLYEMDLNNIKINLDFNMTNSLSNYVNQRLPSSNNKIKNIQNKISSNLNQPNMTVGNFHSNNQSTSRDFQSSYASGFQISNGNDRNVSKNSSQVTTMQFTNGTSTNTTATKQTFQSPVKALIPIQNEKSHLVYSLQDNNFIENINSTCKDRNRFNFQQNTKKFQTPKQIDLSNIVSNQSSKTPSAKTNYKIKDATNVYVNKQSDPNEFFEKNKIQLQKRNAKTPIKQKCNRNDNLLKIYYNQNSPENMLSGFNEKSNKISDQVKMIGINTPINVNNGDIAQSFKIQRNLEKQYINQNFQLRPNLFKVRTQSEGRKRQQNIRVKTLQ
ncbi:hypothetical protein TTHERM_00600420 (macronuclear) [Tetrahymena thermophila SB210]|uniref:Uncharacterized protein n=1 Tax=Tetrahymena thermophila (strain SB210) TaxID=312017 RepID=I7MG45_TETTS|nr:hypothetical protein TTHERM_00600420 [Tetrahymena thermophila SB210]EAR84850.2 hypothetical protein TTHERM_00600420 [Tetrahymena thermophila SB210]|eukprot:XP_001032513.2 hypothetical protein TTHERM_00600420 [Tetrahymena thermophila SB210]